MNKFYLQKVKNHRSRLIYVLCHFICTILYGLYDMGRMCYNKLTILYGWVVVDQIKDQEKKIREQEREHKKLQEVCKGLGCQCFHILYSAFLRLKIVSKNRG